MQIYNGSNRITRGVTTLVLLALVLGISTFVAIGATSATADASEFNQTIQIQADFEPFCPSGTTWLSGRCLADCMDSPTKSCPTDDTCPDGTVLVEGECLVYCPNGYEPEDDECYVIPPTCPAGLELVQGLCYPPCRAGTVRFGTACVPVECSFRVCLSPEAPFRSRPTVG